MFKTIIVPFMILCINKSKLLMFYFRGPVTIAYSLLQNIADVVCSGHGELVSLAMVLYMLT